MRDAQPTRTRAADPVWATYAAIDARRRLRHQLSASVLVALAVAGAAVAVSQLRAAHLYRQASGEGLKFFSVGVMLALSWVAALVASGVLLRLAFDHSERRRGVIVAAVGVLLVVVVAAAAAGWVEQHGDRCIGGC